MGLALIYGKGGSASSAAGTVCDLQLLGSCDVIELEPAADCVSSDSSDGCSDWGKSLSLCGGLDLCRSVWK